MTTMHTLSMAVWLILTTAAATAFAITRHRYAWWAMVALCFPLAGAIWVLTLSSRRSLPPEPTDPPGLEEDTKPGLATEIKLNHAKEEALDDLLDEDPPANDHPSNLGPALDDWARSGD